ncbi:MAG: Fe-S cluster assembly protein SufD [Rubrimonas sp.]
MNAMKQDLAARLLEGPAPAGEAAWAAAARRAAAQRLTDMGGPVKRDEYWKYTDPAPLTAPAAPAAAAPAFDGIAATPLIVGEPAPTVEGVEILPLDRALSADLGFARELFGALEAAGHEKVARPLAALNTARATEGFALRVTGRVAAPLHLIHVPAMARILIRVERGASLTLLESGAAANSLIEVDLAPGARLDHVRVQEGWTTPGAAHVFARVGENAALLSFTLTADGALTRNETVVDIAGAHSRAHVGGAALAKGGAHQDNTVFITHGAPGCESRQVFKNVIDGQARVVFQGKIFVRQVAQKTDGYQISQSILLSPQAEFDAKPELEIYADDVKCSHGSTTGAMDAEAMFYLRARGVPRAQAEALLVSAFVDEAIAEIADEGVADALRARVAAWMAAR